MSGDVQPRKRKDKKKKKDDLGVEEPRGTAAAFGEGDVFMHSQSEHGTGGHWCAKVIFFSLLAVLITLIGLIILENRGLTELEANSVESRYSGVLEGWIEDAPDDDHHDEHTLELKHHDEDDADHGSELEDDDHEVDDHEDDEHENDDDESDEHENDDDEDENDHDEDDDEEADQDADDSEEAGSDKDDEGSEEQDLNAAEDEDDIEEPSYSKYYKSSEKVTENDDIDDDDNLIKEGDEDANEDDDVKYQDDDYERHQDDDDANDQENDDDANDQENDDDKHQDDDDDDEKQNENEEDKTLENNDDDSNENEFLQNDSHEDEDEHEEEEEPANIEIEAIEKEVSDDDAVSVEEPAQEEEEHTDDVSEELSPNEDDNSVEDDDVEFLEPDELDELPIAEPITVPKGKPLAEVGESPSTEKPQDTLAEEEEYERQQEELRKEREQASQGMWLKLTVGGALLVATHAVLRRATASRETDTEDEPEYREETPISDRRMTLISEPVPPPTVAPKLPEVSRPIEREVIREPTVLVQSSPPSKEEIEDEEEEEIIISKPALPVETAKEIDKELYSDEEEIEEEIEEEEEIEPIKPQIAAPQTPRTIPDVTKEVTPEPDEDDDVEIIDEEQLEEELEEEEISDVDDAELLSRLEEKYGRLPEGDKRAQKDGGNSIEDEWPGEPADTFWNEHLEQAQRELRQGEWMAAAEKASAPELQSSARARYIAAQALDAAAEAKKDNQLLNKAIAAYLEVLKMNERLSDRKLLEVATRTLDRIKFRGTYLSAEPVYKLLIRRFPNEPAYRNNMTISLLMANRADLAENVLKETLKLWPNDRVALAHLGFILKTFHNRLEEAVEAFTKALEGDAGAANEPRFYYHLGDALLLLGRFEEAHEVHKRGAALGHFLSPSQRSLYNVDRLKSRPWWNVNETPYSRIARALEKSWKDILKEGQAARELYEKEKEGLKERGEWSQLDLFVRGREIPNRCARAPVTCGIVKSEIAASGCRRGQIKFSMMEAGTHVRPHVGPTNCRLRMHLGLSNTKDTFIRVDRETRQWQTGRVLMFDDSFEHEVWHNGTGARLVLIVDVWHPDLTPAERRQLPAI